MQAAKVSVSLPAFLLEFVENYKVAHQCKSRSQVIEQALELLRSQELEAAYREAAQEVDPIWDVTISDGLSDEAW
ncbi:CopG family transcriptional regulator [Halomicronema sp. CCY15110]|uniref:ribbon-helix-helix domain-containing protein n=1 Tax=Halomicronema sp. CCY15110 TaxID=2767773 RepID=UPI00195099C8|nr:CopG family transcriptional regulator [Halomicronema sp. CCY15110]